MNTNDLPPAAKLAALIEAGRAANPDLKHGQGALLFHGKACAIGFAALAAGAAREKIDHAIAGDELGEASRVLGMHVSFFCGLTAHVMRMNDRGGASLEEICASLREGELAKVLA